MKNILATIGAAGLAIAVAVSGAMAAGYPLNKPREQSWSFAGPFGTYDKGQLQRGLKVYRQVCASCHGLKRVAFRTLEDLGYSEAQIKAFAAEFEVEDGPNDDGEMFIRPALPTDKFPGPYANEKEAALINNGAIPPDLSLIAKARAVERGFPLFVIDIFHPVCRKRPGLPLFAADRLWARAAGACRGAGRPALQPVFQRRFGTGHGAAALWRRCRI